MSRRLFYITRSDVALSPYAEIALPALADAGWEITIAAPNAEDSLLNRTRPFAARRLGIASRSSAGALGHELSVARHLLAARAGPCDVIYVNSQSMSWRAAIWLVGPLGAKRLVYHNPDYYDPLAHPMHARMEGRLCRKAHLYINNEFHRGYITKTAYRLRCPLLTAPPNLPAHWPIPAPQAARRAELAGACMEDPFILTLHGGYSALRMVPQLFEALALLPPRFRLVMTESGGSAAEARAHAARLGILERVVTLSNPTFERMLATSVNADAGVLFYRNNDLGNFFTAPGRLTEYLACGLPVIATNHTGLENLVLRYQLGGCVDTTSPAQIAQGLLRLEAAKRAGMHAAGQMRELFLRHLAFDHWEPIIVRAFEMLASGEPVTEANLPSYPWLPAP